MSMELLFGLVALFVTVAVITGAVASTVLARRAPERQRLNQMATGTGLVLDIPALTDAPSPSLQRFSRFVPKSPKDMTMLRRRLTAAGYNGMDAIIIFSVAKIVGPIFVAALVFGLVGPGSRGLVLGGLGAMCGFMLPEFYLSHRTRARQKVIRNGLPDALDLFIVCLEAGSSLDQAIVKASAELELA